MFRAALTIFHAWIRLKGISIEFLLTEARGKFMCDISSQLHVVTKWCDCKLRESIFAKLLGILVVLALLTLPVSIHTQQLDTPIYLDPKQPIEVRVQDLMSRMTERLFHSRGHNTAPRSGAAGRIFQRSAENRAYPNPPKNSASRR